MSLATDRVALDLVSELSLPTIAVGIREGATSAQRVIARAAARRAIERLEEIRERLALGCLPGTANPAGRAS